MSSSMAYLGDTGITGWVQINVTAQTTVGIMRKTGLT